MKQEVSNGSKVSTSRASTWYQWIAVFVLFLAFTVDIWGIRKNLPYIPEVDEPIFVNAGVHIAGTGDLNPHWFGNPGSTMIYPLAAAFRLWNAAFYHGRLLFPDPNLALHFNQSITAFYLLGRLLSIAYAVLAIALTFSVGRKVFNPRTAVVGAGFAGLSILAVAYSQLVRTDSAGTFFTMLSLWLAFKALERKSLRWVVLGSLAVGLGISTRYFLVALLAPLGLAILFREIGGDLAGVERRKAAFAICATGALALGVVIIAFASSSPFFFLDFSQAWHDLLVEARQNHLGADGLSPIGNLGWYIFRALPSDLGWPQEALAVVGAAILVFRRNSRQFILLAYAATFVFGTILSPLHWDRWMIQVLPILSLFAADAVTCLVTEIKRWKLFKTVNYPLILGLVATAVVGVPAYQVAGHDAGQTLPGTRIEADQWLIAHLPPGSHVAEEWYSAPFPNRNFVIQEYPSLASSTSLDGLRAQGFDYLVVSDYMYGRYFAEPDRYPNEIAVYRSLFEHGYLLQQFQPSLLRSGPVIRVYWISRPSTPDPILGRPTSSWTLGAAAGLTRSLA